MDVLDWADKEVRLYRKYGKMTATQLMELTEMQEAEIKRLQAELAEIAVMGAPHTALDLRKRAAKAVAGEEPKP